MEPIGYTFTKVNDADTLTWLSNPNNIAAVFNELQDLFENSAENIKIYDHQIYAAIGRIMMGRSDYGRRKQELRTDGMMDILPSYLNASGYSVEILTDEQETTTGFQHRYMSITRKC